MTDISEWLRATYEPIVYPAGNTHAAEWDAEYLGVSTLVKKTAEQYAQRILGQESEDRPLEDSYWGFIGNTLCDGALSPITPHREVQFSIPLSDGWTLVGHADGVTLTPDGKVVVNEGKAYGTIDSLDKNDLAHRQAALYLAMCESMFEFVKHQREDFDLKGITFNVADFATDKSIVPLRLDSNTEMWGTCLHVFPRFGPPALVEPRECPAAQRAQVLDFYTRKAEAILQSVRDGNLDAARGWDRSAEGLTEFTRNLPEMFEGPQHDFLLTHAHAKDDADSTIKAAETVKAMSQAEALAVMSATGQDSLSLSDGTVIKAVGGFGGPRRPWLRVNRPKEAE